MQNRSRCGFVEAASRQKEGKDGMIISASRRTDIPACYGQWMMARLRAGEVLVPNPYNASRISRVALSPGNVDCIVFWTKNAAPMLPLLDELDALGYKYYFEYTVTGYGSALEPGLPEKARTVDTFLRLSERLGPEGVDWRFDPVLLTSSITPAWQLERFGALCRALHGATRRCVFSFADPYPGIRSSIAPLEETQMRLLAKGFADIAGEYGLPLYTCAEAVELSEYGIRRASTAQKWSVSQGIPSGWKRIPASARPAAVRRPWISAYTIPVPTAAPTVMPPHARRCCGAPAPSMHRTRRCSPDGRGAANRSQTARALRCVRNRRRCLTTFKSQKGRRPGDEQHPIC